MRISKFVFGLVIILVGAALLFDKLDVSGSAIPGDYWPVLLIVMGFFGWFGRSLFPHLGSMLMMSLGGILLAQNLIDDKSFVDFWPVLAIAVGLSLALSNLSICWVYSSSVVFEFASLQECTVNLSKPKSKTLYGLKEQQNKKTT